MGEVRLLPGAVDDQKRLDRQVARRVMIRLDWLAANYAEIRPEPLTGDLAGLLKLRVGDYRVIYEMLRDEDIMRYH